MRKFLIFLMLFSVFGFANSNDEIMLKSANAYTLVMQDVDIKDEIAKKAKAILIFPSVKKVGFFIGGMYGKGVAVYKNGFGVSVQGAEISNASLGFQFGYEDNYLVIFLMNDTVVNKVLNSQISLGADATAIAGNVGANVGTINALSDDYYVFTNKSGLFVGASLGGVVIGSDSKTAYNQDSYGYGNLINAIRMD